MPNLSKLNFFEGVSKWEKGLRSCPFPASFTILIHPLLPHCNDIFDTHSTEAMLVFQHTLHILD